MMFTRAQARKSGVADVEQPVDGPFGAAPLVRPTQEAMGKPESSPAQPAGPASVSATPRVIPTSEDGLGSRPEGFPLAGISLRCPGGQTGQVPSTEGTQMPPSEQGTCPLPGLATGNIGYQTASSGSDGAATGLLHATPERHSGGHTLDHTLEYTHPNHESSTHDPETAAAARVVARGTDGCRQRPYNIHDSTVVGLFMTPDTSVYGIIECIVVVVVLLLFIYYATKAAQ